MTATSLYLAIIVAGFVPTYAWRLAAVLFVRRIDPDSAALHWVRYVANALVAALVVRLVLSPPGLLAETTLASRIAGLAVAVVFYYTVKRNSAAIGVAAGWLLIFTMQMLKG